MPGKTRSTRIGLVLLIIVALAAIACNMASCGASATPPTATEETPSQGGEPPGDIPTATNTPESSADTGDAGEDGGDGGDETEVEEEEEEEPVDTSECNWDADFVSDVTIPDDTEIAPGATFVKTWRIKNSGCQNWPGSAIMVFDHGDRMGSPDWVAIPAANVGMNADVSVNLTAPTTPGTYQGYFQCQSPDGIRFCQVYVQIVVPEPTPTPTNTPEPTEEAEPESMTIPVTYNNRTGDISTGGCDHSRIRAGIAGAGNAIRGLAAFDLDDLEDTEIVSASLLLNDYDDDDDPFDKIAPLRVEQVEVANSCGPDAMASGDVGDIADIATEGGLSSPVDVTDEVADLIDDSERWFQIRLSFREDDEGSASASMVEWDSISLVVEYFED
ncbi:MAG: hypothetical protein JXJ17_13345 [Anaerolineae bacterium]|nr:hypothetical protein [Anaerolineae bacterium]